MSNNCNVLILTEAGEGIGYGHLTRCSALLDCLAEGRGEHRLLVKLIGNGVTGNERDVFIEDWLGDETLLNDYAKRFDCVVVDSYLASHGQFEYIRNIFEYVVALDDYNRIVYPADLVLNANIFGASLDYSNQNARIVGGRQYVILRSSFVNRGQHFVVRDRLRNILITLGGSDYRKMIPVIADVLRKGDYAIDIVAGTERYKNDLKEYECKNCRLHGFIESKEMVSLMLNVDVVVSGAGQTLNELAFLGLPTIAICIDHDQRLNIETYYQNGFLMEKLYWGDNELSKNIWKLVSKMRKYDVRRKLSENGKAIIDGKGVNRISGIMQNAGL